MAGHDAVFSGNMAEFYERHAEDLFLPYAEDIARRLGDVSSGALLEIAAGTGILTQVLARTLPAPVAIAAIDLNQPMLDFASAKPDLHRVAWRRADAAALPFPNDAFDAVACQFAIMFFPDRPRAHAEARRVLKTGGRYVFNVWGGFSHNPDAEIVERAVAAQHPPGWIGFLGRTPFGYHDPDRIRGDLRAAGFATCEIQTIASVWHAPSAREVAAGYCQGTPLRAEIEAVEPGGFPRAIEAATAALIAHFGPGPYALPRQALVVETTKR